MTIAVITSLYRPLARGGAEIVVETIVDELKKKHRVIVITTSRWQNWRSLSTRRSQEDGVIVYRFYPFNVFSFASIEDGKPFFLRLVWHMFDTFNIHSFFVVRGILKKEKPDAVMTHNIKGIGYSIMQAVKNSGLFHIHTLHDLQLLAPSGVVGIGQDRTLLFRISAGFFSAVHKALFGSPAVVVFPSRFLKSFYDRWKFFPQSHGIVLPNPLPQKILLSSEMSESSSSQKRNQSFQEGRRTFLYLGLIKKQKGIFVLMKAFISYQNPHARLLIAGSGQDEKSVCALGRRDARIAFLGYQNRTRLAEIFSDVHFLVVPSLLYENSPLVIYESFARGVPAIVSESGGASELISDTVNGFTSEPGSQRALEYVLMRAGSLEMKAYQKMCTSAYAHVRDFGAQEYCAQLLTLIQN